LIKDTILFIDHHYYVVVGLPSNSGIAFHRGFLLSGREYKCRLSTILVLYCPGEEPSR